MAHRAFVGEGRSINADPFSAQSEGTDTDNIKSELKDGVLTLALPKRPEVQPKKITVKASSGKAPKA